MIHTHRLVLRRFQSGDEDEVFAYASDQEWARYLIALPDRPYTPEDASHFVETAVTPDLEATILAITLDGRVIGSNSLRIQQPGAASLGYAISRDAWGNGFGTEAAQAFVDWASLNSR